MTYIFRKIERSLDIPLKESGLPLQSYEDEYAIDDIIEVFNTLLNNCDVFSKTTGK